MSAFYLKTRADLVREIDRLGLDLPVAEDDGILHSPFHIGTHKVPNRLCALPMAGEDLDPDGTPSEYTVRRYQRYARAGFGIIWFEATGLDAAGGFAGCVDAVRAISPDALLILQLWPSAADVDAYVAGAVLAQRAGFDGVDIACCYDNRLARELTEGAGLLRAIVRGVRSGCPELMIAVRLEAYPGKPGGFGADVADHRRMDLSGPVALARGLHEDGVELMSVTVSSPNLFGERSEPIPDGATPHEHPLTVLARHQEIGREIRVAAPGLTVVGGGYSWLRRFARDAGAAAVRAGAADVIGLGRLGVVEPGLLTFAEAVLWEEGGRFGRTPAQDAAYRDERLAVFEDIRGLDEDDALVKAFRQGGIEEGYQVLRRDNPLPEMSSHIRSDPCGEDSNARRQLQYVIAWTARDMGLTGVRVPDGASGKRTAVVGGGPTGLAAATRLLEVGHEVALFERDDRLGGAPALVYPEDRLPDPSAEIDALLAPAIAAERLTVILGDERLRRSLRPTGRGSAGRAKTPSEPRGGEENEWEAFDAVLMATGCWQEPSLGAAEGVWSALRFLKAVRRGECTSVPRRVAILCGGDAAMDAAVTAKKLGAERLELVFDCARQDAHWHLPDTWLDAEGVRARFETRAVGYQVDGEVRSVILDGNETVDVDMVIEAMGLYPDEVDASAEKVFVARDGGSVDASMREGIRVAEDIDRFVREGDS